MCCRRRNSQASLRTWVVVVVIIQNVSADFELDPNNELRRPLRVVSTGLGTTPCSTVAPAGLGTLTFRPPRDGLPDGEPLRIPASSFALNRHACEGGPEADVLFYKHIRRRDPRENSLFANVINRLLNNKELVKSALNIMVGTAVNGSGKAKSADAPNCRYGDAASEVLLMRNILYIRALTDLRSPTPNPRVFLQFRKGHLYALANYDTRIPEGNDEFLCVYSDELGTESKGENSETSPNNGKEKNSDDSSGSKAPVAGIVAGLFGVMIALAIILTGAYCWRRNGNVPHSQNSSHDEIADGRNAVR